MLKIIIADDEELIRKRLITRIDWESLGFNHVYEACHGEEVMELIKENTPDILITDIRMPVLDGIELVKKIRDEKFDIEVIVISGFADFKYAQNMLRYGVEDYILKPIGKELLIDAVIKVKEKVFRKITRQQELKDKLLRDVYKGYLPVEGQEKDLITGQYFICKLFIEDKKADELQDGALAIIMEVFDRYFTILLIHESMNKIVLLVEGINQDTRRCINDIFIEINDYQSSGFNFSIYYTELCNDIKDIISFKKQIETVERIRPFLGLKQLVRLADSKVYEEDEFETLLIWIERIIKCINNEEKDLLQETVNMLFDEFQRARLSFEYIIKLCFQMLNHIYRYMQENGKVNFDIKLIYKKVFRDLDHFEFLEDLKIFVFELLDSHLKIIINSEKDSIKYYIEKAISYIENNYTKDISLNIISRHIGLSDTYLSHIFKEYTGINYSEYLRNWRIEKACDLLKHSGLKVYEVATKVGINNSRYFGDVFKEKLGITPNEFKNKYRGTTNE